MAISVTHTTPADGTFSAAGAAAWDATHAVTGLATVAETGDYANLTGTPVLAEASLAWPVGSIYISTRSTSPTTLLGFGTWTAVEGQFLVGTKAGDPDFSAGASGGSTGVTSMGSVSKPTFTGDNYTPSGNNATVSFTPSGTIDMTLYVPKGTNSTSPFTPSGTLAWPATAPAFAGTTVTATASVNWPTGQPAFGPTKFTATASVNWPTATPSASGNAHQHELPFIATSNVTLRVLTGSVFGLGGTSRVPAGRVSGLIADTTGSGVCLLSNTATATVSIVWPVSVPQAVASISATGSVAWPASVPQAVVSVVPAGVVTWPSGTPAFTGTAGTVPAQTFTGAAGSGSAIFTGVLGTVPAQTFTGIAKAVSGSISQPVYTGDKTSVLPPYRSAYMWERTA